jgi:hypothetical protein
MSATPTAGHQTTLSFLHEDNGFNSSPTDSDNKPFGYDATLSTLDGSHNAVRVFDPNDREAARIVEQEFSGSFTVDFTLANPWWFQEVFGSASTSGSGPYTHTFADGTGGEPTSMRILQGDQNAGFERVLTGCIVTDVDISFDVPGQITVSLSGAYADEPDSSISVSSQPTVQREPLMTHHAQLDRDGTTLDLIQSVGLSISTNDALIYGLGDRNAVAHNPKSLQYDLDYAEIVENADAVQRFYGNDTTLQEDIDNEAAITITADNGKTGSAQNKIEWKLTDVFPNEHSRSGVGDPDADIEDELSEISPTVTVVAENDDSSAR